MELLISLISHVELLYVTWFDLVVFPLKELGILPLWQLQVVKLLIILGEIHACLVVCMSYCPLVGETISSLGYPQDRLKTEQFKLYVNHLRLGANFCITSSQVISMLPVLELHKSSLTD